MYRKTIAAAANIPPLTTDADPPSQTVNFGTTLTFVKSAEVMLDLGSGVYQPITVNGRFNRGIPYRQTGFISLWAIRNNGNLDFYANMPSAHVTGTFYITLEYTKD